MMKTMNPRFGAALGFVALLSLAGPPAAATGEEAAPREDADPRASEVLSRLDARLESVRSLKGRFVQTFTSSGLGIPQAEEGIFSIRRPDRMRWEYRKPERKLAVSDGTHTWLYMPEEGVVYRGDVRDWKEGGAFALLAGGSLSAEFVALSVGVEGASREGDLLLELRPAKPRDQYEQLLVQFEPSSLSISSITAVDAMGNRISVILSDLQEDPEMNEGEFTFRPPAGVRVIEQGRPATPEDVAGSSRR